MDEQFPRPSEEIAPLNAQPPNSRRSMISVALSWFFIAATIVFSQMPQYKGVKERRPSNAAPDLPMQMTGKYIVGVHSLMRRQPALKSRLELMVRSLQKKQSVRSQLYTVPILAELSGREAALNELKRLEIIPSSGGIARDLLSFQQLYQYGEASLNPQQRFAIKGYGWFGQLALSQDNPDSNPARKAVLLSALRTVVVLVILTLVILAGLTAGLTLLTTAIVLWSKGSIRSHLTMPVDPDVSLLEAFAIYIAGFMALPAVIAWLFPGFRIAASLLAIAAVILAIFWPRFRGSDWKNYRTALGWSRGKGFFHEIGAGIVGYIAGLPLLIAAAAFVALISRHSGITPVHPIVYEINRNPLHLMFLAILACVWAPIIEETFFRGVLFGYFRRHVPWAVSGVLSALLFGMVHPQGWLGVPAIGMIGFILSAIREWRGSLIASMSAHALNNASVLLLLILILN